MVSKTKIASKTITQFVILAKKVRLNYCYHPDPENEPVLSTEESAHVVKVLRGKSGSEFTILDGKGNHYLAQIDNPDKRKCTFKILNKNSQPQKPFFVHIAIAPTKNTDRLEWFVEKACELGVGRISIILTQRTERSKVNLERLEKKAISAMKQSKNLWKSQIGGVFNIDEFINQTLEASNKFAAYVETGQEHGLESKIVPNQDCLILIGPEGDFDPDEIQRLKNSGFELVSLGPSVLRTETAGVIATHTVNMVNQLAKS